MIKKRCEIIIRNLCRASVIVPRVHDMIVLVHSSEPFIGEHRGDGGQVGGRQMLVAAREESKERIKGCSKNRI